VPVLEPDNGHIAPMVQYIADLAPAAKLASPIGSIERYRVAE
jgi:hypothetical protein